MPVDQYGNRAEIIMDGDSTIKRMNIGRMYEQYINATSESVTRNVREMRKAIKDDATFTAKAWEYLLGYYKTVSPRMHALITSSEYPHSPEVHVADVLENGIYLWVPTDNPVSSIGMIQALRKDYPVGIGPVTYRGRSGNLVTTKTPVLIGSMYIMLLEKTGEDWSGVSSAKLQTFGMLARITKYDKHSAPARPQPVRMLGESEVRLAAAVVGGKTTAELVELSNSPQLHKEVVANILRSETPTNIEEVVDRKQLGLTIPRNLVYVKHALETAGARFASHSDEDDTPYIYQHPQSE